MGINKVVKHHFENQNQFFVIISLIYLRKAVDVVTIYLINTWKILSNSGFPSFHGGLGYETQNFPF